MMNREPRTENRELRTENREMATTRTSVDVPHELVDAIRSFPAQRELEHCGKRITVSPFDFYAQCPECGGRIKVRSFSGVGEIEDVFDAVFEWMQRPEARPLAEERLRKIAEDGD